MTAGSGREVGHEAGQRSAPAESVLTVISDGVGTITLNRPAAMNALDNPTKDALLTALERVGGDETVRCVVLTGSGRAFCVGQDLREHAAGLRSGDQERLFSTVPDQYNPIALGIAQLDKPVIAGLNGVAAGAGASLAFLADYRLLAASAGFNTSFTAIGLSCDTGASWSLPRLIGQGRAMDLLLNPRTVGAEEALRIGLASEVVPDAEFADRLGELSARWAAGPTRAYAAVRRAVGYAAGHPLSDALSFEARLMNETGATDDHRQAVEAFLAKETPRFVGR